MSLKAKANSLLRYGLVHGLAGPLKLYIINEYPRSGGTWMGQMLSHALGLEFPRKQAPPLRSCVIHGHYLSTWGMRNVLLVWRDGRDVLASWYHHCLTRDEQANRALIQTVRADMPFDDYENVREHLPEFIEYAFTRQRSPRFSWSDFVRNWHERPGTSAVKYEDLQRNAAGELRRLCRELASKELTADEAQAIADEYSFAKRTGRKPGEEDKGSFMRKGIVGDWQNCFSRRAAEVFDRFAGDELIRLGYEPDHSWVERVDE